MKRIPLRRRDGSIRAHALVDDGDYERLAAFRWCLQLGARGGYAVRTDRSGARQRTVLLHRQLLGLGHGDRREVDHWNGDKLDCRRENLRVVLHAANAQNRRKVHGRSRFRGVSWNPRAQAWAARVGLNYQRYFGGYFTDEEAAGRKAAEMRAALLTHTPEAR